MKKFVIVMISLLVLFVFLMLNYLLWDKENLLKQRDTDKLEQDWLRGQNLTLQSTVDELQRNIETLKGQNDTQRNRIVELERQVSEALQRENSNLLEIQDHKEALRHYKSFMEDEIYQVAEQFFARLTSANPEESWAFLDKSCKLWGRSYSLDQYIELISGIKSITIKEDKDTDVKPFVILADQGGAYEIKSQIRIEVSLNEEKGFIHLDPGENTLEVIFTYNTESAHWAIASLSTLKVGKP